MTRNAKIAVGVGILGAGVGAYFLIQYLILKKRYNTTLSPSDAAIVIKQQADKSTGEIIPDEITNNADLQKGTEVEEITDSTYNNDNSQNVNDSVYEFELYSGYGDY